MTAKNALPALSNRGLRIVEWLSRYGVTLLWIVATQHPELSQEALRKFLERLAEDGWLVRHRLPAHRENYWMLSTQACNRLGLKRSGSPLRQGPLIRQVLTALFFATNRSLQLLTAAECAEMIPSVYRRGTANRYFLDVSNAQRVVLGWLLVDGGKAPLRIWSKAKQIAAAKKAIPELFELCLAGRFELAVATTTPDKARKIETLFEDRPLAHISVRIVPVINTDTWDGGLFVKAPTDAAL